MSETPVTPTPTEPPVATATPPVPTPPVVTPDPSDIDGYKNLVAKLRDEVKAAKADRTPQDEKDAKAIAALKRQLESTPSPEDVRKELAQQIGKALGLVEENAPVDPAKLTEQLTATQTQARQAALELAVFRSSPDSSVANSLLDSRSFLAKVADLDPSDGIAIAAAVGDWVTANPALGKRAPAPNPAQGSSAAGPGTAAQLSEQDVDRLMREGKHDEVEKARIEGRLNDLLGIK